MRMYALELLRSHVHVVFLTAAYNHTAKTTFSPPPFPLTLPWWLLRLTGQSHPERKGLASQSSGYYNFLHP